MNEQAATPENERQNTPKTPPARRGRVVVIALAVALVLSLAGNLLLWGAYTRIKTHAEDMDATYSESYFYFDSLTVDSFEEKVAAGDSFIVLITRPNCSNCARLERPFIELALQRGITGQIYLLNVVLLRRDDAAWAAFKETYGFEGTPTYARFADGQLVSNVGWTYESNIDLSMVEEWVDAQEDFWK